jgi:hypothetical protein
MPIIFDDDEYKKSSPSDKQKDNVDSYLNTVKTIGTISYIIIFFLIIYFIVMLIVNPDFVLSPIKQSLSQALQNIRNAFR